MKIQQPGQTAFVSRGQQCIRQIACHGTHDVRSIPAPIHNETYLSDRGKRNTAIQAEAA